MSQNSSQKKPSITSSDEYVIIEQLYRAAYDRLQSGGIGAGWSGIHYELMEVLRKYGRVANSREQALAEVKKLLNEYAQTYLEEKPETDEEFLDRYEDEL